MKLKTLGKNQTELTLCDGTVIFFSYQTPVAACRPYMPLLVNGADDVKTCFIRTQKTWSPTTANHISKWLDGRRALDVDQSVLDGLADGGEGK